MKSIASRWWRKPLRIAIHPDRVCIARVVSERHDRLLDARLLPVSAGAYPWDAAINVLRRVLDDYAHPDVPARVILSSHFTRYAVVPWRDNLTDRAEQVEFARHCFRSLYGASAEHWDVRVSDGGYRRNALACAIDREWILCLDKVFKDCRMQRVSVQPWFMAASNRYRVELNRHGSACVAVVEDGRVALGTFDRFGWHSLSVRKLSGPDPAKFAPVLAQELLSARLQELPEHLFVITVGDNTSSLLRSRTRHWILPEQARVPGLFEWKSGLRPDEPPTMRS